MYDEGTSSDAKGGRGVFYKYLDNKKLLLRAFFTHALTTKLLLLTHVALNLFNSLSADVSLTIMMIPMMMIIMTMIKNVKIHLSSAYGG